MAPTSCVSFLVPPASMTTLDLGPALTSAVRSLRDELGDPTASVLVLTPSAVNGTFARRELAFDGAFVRVAFLTPASLRDRLAHAHFARHPDGRRAEPSGWLRATLESIVAAEDLGPYGDVLRDPGWLEALHSAVASLEEARMEADDLTTLEGVDGARTTMLSRVLGHVRTRRETERLRSPKEVADAAMAGASDPSLVPCVHRGAILLGETRLPRRVFDPLVAYLAERPVVRLSQRPLELLGAEPLGLAGAAPHARTIEVASDPAEILIVRTPDPVREIPEAVRDVCQAIEEGVALDRIAIVLPDPSEAATLRDALERAEVPAVWQTGGPLASTPAAGFLRLALSMATTPAHRVAPDDDVVHWYELLRLPGLALRRRLGEDATRGRGRWRRLLASCGAHRGLHTLLAALDAHAEERLLELAEDPDLRAAEADAFASLKLALSSLGDALRFDVDERPLGGWARAFRGLLETWWPALPDRHVVASLLDTWSRTDAGPSLTLAQARALLEETLRATEHLRGSLKDAAVRVLSPMQLLGGRFDRVCVTGLSQRRFPALPQEDPLLSDALVDALEAARPGTGLFRSTDRAALDRRRFAAIRAATRGRLWLSTPGVDLQGRPLLPSTLLLELESERRGARVSFYELEAATEARGRRSRPFCQRPNDALGDAEHLLARLHAPSERDRALEALVDHPWGRRQVRLQLALHRWLKGDRSPELRPFVGFVRVPCVGLDGTPLSPAALAELVADPFGFFWRRVLGAWSARRLYAHWDPIRSAPMRQLEAARRALDDGAPIPLAMREADTRAFERAGELDREWMERVAARSAEVAGRLDELTPGPRHPLKAAPISDELPWRVDGGDARRHGSSLEWLVLEGPGPRSIHKARAALLEAAARRADVPFDQIHVVGLLGKSAKGRPEHVEAAVEELAAVTELARQGFYPCGGSTPSQVLEAEAKLFPRHGRTHDEWRATLDALRHAGVEGEVAS